MNKYLKFLSVGLLINACILSAHAQDDESEAEWSTVFLYESQYVSEGRDNLDKGGMASLEVAYAKGKMGLFFWYADGLSVDYRELNLGIEYVFEFSGFEGYCSYTRLEFLDDDEFDNELGLGLSRQLPGGLVAAVDYVYSTESIGAFMELSLRGIIESSDGSFAVEPYIVQGIDFGYASDNYNGLNHLQIGLDLSFNLHPETSIIVGAAHSFAQADVERNGGSDETWGLIGVVMNY